MEVKKITIIDVAKRAGVSKGTVDRVIHNRGEVSKKSVEKVRKAIEALHFEPNLNASILASRKSYSIALLMPSFSEGEYWQNILEGFEKGIQESSHLNVRGELFCYDQYDPESFRRECEKVLEFNPSGVVMPPFFIDQMKEFSKELSSRGIPYVYVDSKIEDDSYLAYYGMPMYKSGYLCAGLLTERLDKEDVKKIAIIRILRDKARKSDPTLSRRMGFMDYISENYPDCETVSVFIDPSSSQKEISSSLEEFFSKHEDASLVAMFNSRIHLIHSYLKTHPKKGRRVIGYDNLDRNVEMLKDDSVTILIAQKIHRQSCLAVHSIVDYVQKNIPPTKKDNYMHMDILTSLNYEDY